MTTVDSDSKPPADWGELPIAQLLHDLSNQLTLISGSAANLAEVIPRGTADAEISALRMCSERASQLVRQLLTEGSFTSSPHAAIDLNAVIAPLGELLARVGGPRNLVRLRLSSEPAPVLASVPDLERIVVNLALNAFDALSGPGLVTIETEVVGRVVRLSVRDTGAGMEAEVKEKAFNPYFTTKPTGTGLGMPSVAFTVRRLRGSVAVESALGQGTVITVVLPIVPPRR